MFKLKYSTGYAAAETQNLAFNLFLDMIEERSGGRIVITDRYSGGALGTVPEHMELTKKGIVDIGNTQVGARPSEFPLWEIERMFLFGPSNHEISHAVLWQLRDEFPEFEQLDRAQNLKWVSIAGWGSYHLISWEPMTTLADFEGKVIALWGVIMPRWVAPLGAGGQATSAAERYLAMQNKTVDSSMLTVVSDVANKLYEQGDYYTIINTMDAMAGTVHFNLDVWNRLPADLQQMILTAGREASMEYARNILPAEEEKALQVLKRELTMLEMPIEEKRAWEEMLAPTLPRWWAEPREKDGWPAYAILTRYYEIAEELGHEWLIDYRPYLKK